VVSLRDVQAYAASRIVKISEEISLCQMLAGSPNPRFTRSQARQLVAHLNEIAKEAKQLSLPMTAKLALRLARGCLSKKTHPADIMLVVHDLSERLSDETEDRNLFLVNPLLLQFYENSEIAGEQFKANFLRGNVELIEAGNCLTLARHTACVFHLIRALDIALTSLQTHLGIPLPTNPAGRTWGRTLGRIKDVLDAPPAQWNDQDKEFFHRAYTFLQAAKTAYRDVTMHVESSYDEASARSAFNVTVEVLKHLAARLKE